MSEFGAILAGQITDTDVAARIDEFLRVLLRRDPADHLVHLAKRSCGTSGPGGESASNDRQHRHVFDRRPAGDANGIASRAAMRARKPQHGGNRASHRSDADSQESYSRWKNLSQRIKATLRDDLFVIQYQPRWICRPSSGNLLRDRAA